MGSNDTLCWMGFLNFQGKGGFWSNPKPTISPMLPPGEYKRGVGWTAVLIFAELHWSMFFSDRRLCHYVVYMCVCVCLQGILYKKSSKPLSKEWKKKYVTLLEDGRLTYHPSLHVRVPPDIVHCICELCRVGAA